MLRLGHYHLFRSAPSSSTHSRIITSIGSEYTGHPRYTTMSSVSRRRSARLLSAQIHIQSQTISAPNTLAEVKALPVASRQVKRRKIEETAERQVKPNGSSVPQASPSTEQDYCKVTEDYEEAELDCSVTAKPKRRRRPQVDPVYVIADVEKKQTTFKGRLGYACLNTILRNKKPATESVFCSRTCRLDSLKKHGVEFAKDLGRKNIEDLLTIIQWNEDNNIRFFRLSSEMFPYASHGTYGYTLEYCSELLAKAGALAKKYGHRLTTHPGQFTQLGSPKPLVVQASVRELTYHCQMLDIMGMGPDSVMIIHGGGVYNDKSMTLSRLKQSIKDLPRNVRQRLVLENDEMCYNAEDLLPICEELDVPLVFDYHHHNLFPSSLSTATIIERANAIFSRRGIKPKQHLSEPRPGAISLMERRAHSDRCENLPAELPDGMDLMIEAKDKEQAVFHLYRMYDLQPVIYENPSMHTSGRKSTKRARAKLLKENALEDGDE